MDIRKKIKLGEITELDFLSVKIEQAKEKIADAQAKKQEKAATILAREEFDALEAELAALV